MLVTPTDILKYWHKIEFFTPFDLDEVCRRPTARYRLTGANLAKHENQVLPWFSPSALSNAGATPEKLYRYNLYLLPFDKSELTRQSDCLFPSKQNAVKQAEFEERLADEGLTCFAKLEVGVEGHPDYTRMSISTLPWAMNKMSHGSCEALTMDQYRQEQISLKTALSNLAQVHGVLTGVALLELLEILKTWAGFSPTYPDILVLELIEVKPKKVKESPETVDEIADDEELIEDDETDLPILNSFFIEELERVMNDGGESLPETIAQYLMGMPEAQRIDLYAAKNVEFIFDKLSPAYLNYGRWPSDSRRCMSLMQQFAINETFHSSTTSHLFSVNGPPGTGKTTLLQDIIAENVVRRAKVFLQFNNVDESFVGTERIVFQNHSTVNFHQLDPRLTGFEILVASTNNKAAENISKELPLKRHLSNTKWQECSYLGAIATKVAAEHRNCEKLRLESKKIPWGLISIALGNAKNCRRFCNGAFFVPELEQDPYTRVSTGEFLNIWEWRKVHRGPSFEQAKLEFKTARQTLKAYLQKIRQCAELTREIKRLTIEKIDLQNEQLCLKTEVANLLEKQQALHNERQIFTLRKNQLQTSLTTHRQLQPRFTDRLCRTPVFKSYQQQHLDLLTEWKAQQVEEQDLSQRMQIIDTDLQQKEIQIEHLTQKIIERQQIEQEKKTEYQSLFKQLEPMSTPPDYPNDGEEITQAAQEQAVWQNATLNQLRTQLFVKALGLHEAWLFESLEKKYFTGNLLAISKILTGQSTLDPQHDLVIWQSLFMWVPVVSSTFASIGKLFKKIGREQLGLLLIDEAGQAIPQAAVGAIWRAKRIVVVGDPLQIEPVLTIPLNLIEGLAHQTLERDYEQWLPNQVSVQLLADQANILGAYTEVAGEKYWIGSPLQIHRRCLDPMFSIANRIAYNHKMIQARLDQCKGQDYPLGESAWFDIRGKASDKQYVVAQGKFVVDMFERLYGHADGLPNLYVITPFKRIKHHLQPLLIQTKLGKTLELKTWCADRVGTIHTFQGREARTVLLILGADAQTTGAMRWASAKPNLLNVALTRAQDRIYVIGDHSLWSKQAYFEDLARNIPVKTKLPVEINPSWTTSHLGKIHHKALAWDDYQFTLKYSGIPLVGRLYTRCAQRGTISPEKIFNEHLEDFTILVEHCLYPHIPSIADVRSIDFEIQTDRTKGFLNITALTITYQKQSQVRYQYIQVQQQLLRYLEEVCYDGYIYLMSLMGEKDLKLEFH